MQDETDVKELTKEGIESIDVQDISNVMDLIPCDLDNNKQPTIRQTRDIDLATLDNELMAIEKAFEIQERAYQLCLKKIKKQHVLNYNSIPYIRLTGLVQFLSPYRIYQCNIVREVILKDGTSRDLKEKNSMQGEWEYVRITGTIGSKLLGIECEIVGGVKLKDLNKNVNEDKLFWVKMAIANWLRRALTLLLGIDGLDWEDLGLKESDCKSVTHGTTQKADSEKSKKVWDNLLMVCNGNVQAAEQKCVELTAFPDKKTGQMVAGKPRPHNLSEVALSILTGKVDKLVKDYNVNRAVNETPDYVDDIKQEILKQLGEYYKNEKVVFNRIMKKYNYTTDMLKTNIETKELEKLLTEIEEATQQ
jgi:polyhydroxyalkanoate synthesis regulator phasin